MMFTKMVKKNRTKLMSFRFSRELIRLTTHFPPERNFSNQQEKYVNRSSFLAFKMVEF